MSRAFVTQSISSTALFVCATLILATSLISSNRMASGVHQRFSTLEFYVGKQILPDHPFYSVLMARDRIKLWVASDEEEPRLRLQYAERRYQFARELAAAQKNDLAISTLSKSQTYALEAVRQFQVQGMSDSERTELRSAIEHSLYRMELFQAQYPELNTSMLQSLRAETSQLLKTL